MSAIELRLSQQLRAPTKLQIDKKQNWIIIFSDTDALSSVKDFPYASLLSERRQRMGRKPADAEPVLADLPNKVGSHISFACVAIGTETFKLLTLARKLVAAHANAATIGVAIIGFEPIQAERIAEATIAASYAKAAKMPSFKSADSQANSLKRIELFGVHARHGFKRTIAEAEGNAVARYLSMLPANKLTPAIYLKYIRQLTKEHGWKLEFLDEKILKKKKAGAFLAVSQGGPNADAGIVRLEYRPTVKRPKGKLGIVGKGICFDTGGANLKPAKYMFGMHEDMQGSAVALGTLIALSKLKVNFVVECWLALATNHIGPKAYKPNDVVTAIDGTTIEVVHTDAEGRMVLADTLVLASRKKPKLLIDYATLTGACIYSIGSSYSGVFTNREELHQKLIDAGKDSGERVWPFPMDEDYDKAIESNIADVKQCIMEGNADHILASRFLQRFVKEDTPWVHMDLAAGSVKGGLAHIPSDTTGFGIRVSLNMVLDKKLM